MELINFIGVLSGCIGYIFGICILNKVNFNKNKKNIILAILILTILMSLNENIKFLAIKPLINFILLILIQLLLLRNDYSKILLTTIFIFTFSFLFEMIVVIVLYMPKLFNNNLVVNDIMNSLNYNTLFSFLMNFSFSLSLIFMSSRNFSKNFYDKIINLKTFKNINNILRNIILPITIFAVAYLMICYGESRKYLLILFAILTFILLYIIIKNIKISTNYDETKEKYTNTLKSLTEYEDMIDKYRVSNHENKNQLQMIRTMIHQKDKTVEKYIDNLLDNVYMVNEKLMMDVSMLPSGIKATVYTKMVLMENKRIKYKLNVDRKLRMVDYFDYESSIEIGLKICNILSVFLDNAIEEVENKKDPEIYIEVFYDENDNELTFEISNEIYTKDVDTSKIFEKGYTTKSNGHGYGLALVKEIIDANNNLKNETIIKNNIFTQRLTLKLK